MLTFHRIFFAHFVHEKLSMIHNHEALEDVIFIIHTSAVTNGSCLIHPRHSSRVNPRRSESKRIVCLFP